VTKGSKELYDQASKIVDTELWSAERIHWDFSKGNIPTDEPYRRILARLREDILITREYTEQLIVRINDEYLLSSFFPSVFPIKDVLFSFSFSH
jgi:hypothetical protein